VLNFFPTYWGQVALQPSLNRRSRVRFGQFEVDLVEKRLLKLNRPIRLENKPFQVLVALFDRRGELVTREELHARLWGDGTYVDFDGGLNTAIKKLRFALGDSADTPVFIETVPRRGYRFLAPIEIIESETSSPGDDIQPDPAPTALPTVPSVLPAVEPYKADQTVVVESRWRKRAAGLMALCLLVVAGSWIVHRERRQVRSSRSPRAMDAETHR